MSLISFSTISDGSTAQAAQVNTPLTTIYNDYNGNITDANISASAAIGAGKLAGGIAGMFGASSSWTPTFTNLTIGNGTLSCNYIQIGKHVSARFYLKFGSTTSISGDLIFTLPATAVAYTGTAGVRPIGMANMYNTSSSVIKGIVNIASTTTANIRAITANSTYADNAILSSTVPFTWATNYEIGAFFSYEAA